MSNFFEDSCREVAITTIRFGICDPQNGAPAYVDHQSENDWIAIVSNPDAVPINFTAIDNCIDIRRDNGDMDLRCDGMIDYEENIIFVELKNQITGGWSAEGVTQIESTILHFQQHHDLSVYKYKRAFVINKKRKRFQVIDTDLKKRLFQTYRIRINIGGDITIK